MQEQQTAIKVSLREALRGRKLGKKERKGGKRRKA